MKSPKKSRDITAGESLESRLRELEIKKISHVGQTSGYYLF